MVAGYTTLLCTGLHFVTSSLGEADGSGEEADGTWGGTGIRGPET